MNPRRYGLSAVLLGAAGFGLDWATKQWALASLDPSDPVQVIPGQLYLRLIRNPGAAFSMGESFTVVLTCLAIAALIFLLGWMVPRVRHRGWTVAAGLLLAGVSGNLFDRLFREPGAFHGHVVDFLQVPWFAVFNVADIWITFAAVTVIWLTVISQVNLAGDKVEHGSAAERAER
ncbi:MAG: signal peptidase II [Micropruina sp.]|uniref:signal peptidase II n=1 Tax=Micropruina sp. TaxID=2737536 RepID=UPI0039E3D84D